MMLTQRGDTSHLMTWTLQTQLENPSTPIENEIAAMGPWFHNLHLPDGTQTAPNHPLGDFPSFKWGQLADYVPEDLTGWTALDIGCNSGFYSFELARRGATVRAVDVEPHYLRQARWAAKLYGLEDRITFEELPLYDLARESGTYDIVWFMGVLYHLRYPLLALDIIGRKVDRLMVMQSLTTDDREVVSDTSHLMFDDIQRMTNPGWPKMSFVENDLLGDSTNWWIPNEACLQAMLRSSGFDIQAQPALGTFVCTPMDAAKTQFRFEGELKSASGRQD
jgi:tRNA (mo5U34)-methyltransferase